MRKLYGFITMLVLGSTSLLAQQGRTCGTMDHLEMLKQNDPSAERNMRKLDSQIQEWIRENGDNHRGGNLITIPTVVHVVYRTSTQNISDTQIFSQIAVFNEDFRKRNADTASIPAAFRPVAADCEIEFCLAQRDPTGAPSTGITRTSTTVTSFTTNDAVKRTTTGGKDAWPRADYLNIWVCNLGGGLLGYAQFPGQTAATDGVVIGYNYFGRTGAVTAPFNKGRTGTHEVGHWLGLYHTFQGGCAGTSASNCASAGDQICDTPPVSAAAYGCPGTRNTCTETPTDQNDMTMNYMDYVDDACMYLFTNNQRTRMRSVLNGSRVSLQSSNGCLPVSLPAHDASVSSITAPTGTICADQVTPVFVLKNFGSNPLTSVTINWSIDGGTNQTQPWTGNLASLSTTNVTLPAQTVAPGGHSITIFTTSPNGQTDGNPSNDSKTQAFTTTSASAGQAVPFAYGFQPSTFPPSGWTLNNPDGGLTWERSATVGMNSTASAWVNNFDYNSQGQKDELILPGLDLSGASGSTLTWDLAYALYSQTGFSDTLRVHVSVNCGTTWTMVYEKYGQPLTTVTPYYQTTRFIPSSASQWRAESVNLTPYVGNGSVMIRFTNVTDYENNLYIDNINIAVTGVSINEATLAEAVAVYPNPSAGKFNVDLRMPAVADLNLVVYDMAGKQVAVRQLRGFSNGTLNFDLSNEAIGIYFLRVESEGVSIVKKIALN